MAVRAFVDEPGVLLSAITRGIADGRIKSWRVDKEGDFTLTSENFGGKAWMRPKVLSDRLLFNIVGVDGDDMSTQLYAIYHARLIQMLLMYFDKQMKTASATALGTSGDLIPD